jgi:hypothetical protein
VARAVAFLAAERGAVVKTVAWPVPIDDPARCVASLERALGPRTRLAVLDHVTSETALVLPVAQLAAACRAHGVAVLVDGAHAPGAIEVRIETLGVDWYSANLHKWAFAPRGCGVLWAAPHRREGLHPAVISWGVTNADWLQEFDWTGTRDPTPWLCAPAAIDFLEHELGAEAMRAHNHALAWNGAVRLAARWQRPWRTPESMVGCMAAVPCRAGSTAPTRSACVTRCGSTTASRSPCWRATVRSGRACRRRSTTTTKTWSASPTPSTRSRSAERRLQRARRMLRLTELACRSSTAMPRCATPSSPGSASTPRTACHHGLPARIRRAQEAAIVFVYTIDCDVRGDEAAVLARHAGRPARAVAPDTRYRPPVVAPADFRRQSGATGRSWSASARAASSALCSGAAGLRPLVLERGKAVRERTKDTWGLWRRGVLDPESNVQFGEGGAGTFLRRQALEPDQRPAPPDAQGDRRVRPRRRARGDPLRRQAAHRHVPLVGVVERMRHEIERLGGEVRFGARVVDLRIDGGAVRGSPSCSRRRAKRTRLSTSNGTRSTPSTSSSPWGTAHATRSRCCTSAAFTSRPSRSRSAFASSTRSRSSTAPASDPTPVIRFSAPPTTGSSTMRRTAAPSTASACAPAAPSSPRPRSRSVSSPTA